MISQSAQDFLKCVYTLSLNHEAVIPSLVADELGVSAAAVTKMGKRLAVLKLLRRERRQGLKLTSAGRKIALEVIRHHRLLELYLFEALGYTWDQVHEEAERLEHVISKTFIEKIDAYLGFPTHDPHGSPIPGRDLAVEDTHYPTLRELKPGQEAIIQRVSKDDSSLLRYMGELGMYPGTPVKLLSHEPFGGPIHVLVSGKQQAIGALLADQVLVVEKEKKR